MCAVCSVLIHFVGSGVWRYCFRAQQMSLFAERPKVTPPSKRRRKDAANSSKRPGTKRNLCQKEDIKKENGEEKNQ
jgi:hypothetical protein